MLHYLLVKIALVLLPQWSVELPPLGMASLAAVLRAQGHEVRTFDWNVKLQKELGPQYWDLACSRSWGDRQAFKLDILPKIAESLSLLAREIITEKYQVVGFTMYRSNALTIGWFSTLLKFLNPEIKIAIGGPDVSLEPWHRLIQYQFTKAIDAAVVGEGESSMLELCGRWSDDLPIHGILGVITVKDGQIVYPGRPPAMDVNSILPPDFSDYDLGAYEVSSLPVQFSRGCVANCTFCNEKAFLWPSFQMTRPSHVLDQLRTLIKRHNIRRFSAADSLLNGNHAKLGEFIDMVKLSGDKFKWEGNMRIDKRLLPLTEKLKSAGCISATFGVESGSNNVLKAMRKGITRDDTVKVLNAVYQSGIKCKVNLIVGFPGETEDDFLETMRLVDDVGDWIGSVNATIFTIDPHTDVGRFPEKYGIRLGTDGKVYEESTSPYIGNTWFSNDGISTPDIRFDRLLRLRTFLKERMPRAYFGKIANG